VAENYAYPMGSLDDPNLKIRQVDDSPTDQAPNRRTVVGVAVLAVVAFAAIFGSTGQNAPATATTIPRASPIIVGSTTLDPAVPDAPSVPVASNGMTQSSRLNELLDDGMRIWDFVPDAASQFVVVVGNPTGTDLVQVSPGEALVQLDAPIGGRDTLRFDVSGRHLAYIGDSPNTDDSALYVDSDPSDIIEGANSFAWHATTPGRIAWIAYLPQSELCWADVSGPGLRGEPMCMTGPDFGFRLVAFDDDGFVAIDDPQINRLDRDGQVVASVPGRYAWSASSSDLLIAERDRKDNLTLFTMIDAQFADPRHLDWAPAIPTDEPVGVAVSPSEAYPEIAFLTGSPGQSQLQVWDLDGRLAHTVHLEGQVWGVEWDNTGRYILLPGTVETEHLVYVYDTQTRALTRLPFGGRVQQAVLASPSICAEANEITDGFAQALPEGVQLGPSRMVKSRDANLLSFYFVSAEILGGPDNGQIATWALPGFNGEPDGGYTPIAPINEPTERLGLRTNLDTVLASSHTTDEWLQLDGVLASQRCAREAGG
jgi:hypothetical protein